MEFRRVLFRSATPRGGSPEGFGTAPSEVAPVLLMLDDQFRIRSGDGSGAHLFDAPPRAGRPIFDLVGDYPGGDEPPGPDCAYPPLPRIESRFRTGAGGRTDERRGGTEWGRKGRTWW